MQEDKVVKVWRPSRSEQKPPEHPICKGKDCAVPPPQEVRALLSKLARSKSMPWINEVAPPAVPLSRMARIAMSESDEEYFTRKRK